MNNSQAAAALGVSTATLRRWMREGLVPEYEGDGWTPAALGKARLIARLRQRGYSITDLKAATEEGRLAFGQVLALFDQDEGANNPASVARELGISRRLLTRLMETLGVPAGALLTDQDVGVLRYFAAAIETGLPVDALVQLARVYVQATSQVADSEVRLVHLYVHEPLMRSAASAEEVADELYSISSDLFPLTGPLLAALHRRMLSQFIELDVVGHMGHVPVAADGDVGRVRVAIAFADLTGYTELTETAGDLHAVDVVDRFLAAVTSSLPEDARVVKTIGDEVMIVGPDAGVLVAWAVEFLRRHRRRPRPKIGIHFGDAQYRDGDYYGHDVNVASRVAAQSGEGQVLVTASVVDAADSALHFERLEAIELKGVAEPVDLYVARS